MTPDLKLSHWETNQVFILPGMLAMNATPMQILLRY